MNRYTASERIVAAVLKDLAGRRGCDIEEIVDDAATYDQIKDDLFEIVVDILFQYVQELRF